jgi:hypothetical protein
VFIELHPRFLPSFGATADDVREVTPDAGYSLLRSRARDDELPGDSYRLKEKRRSGLLQKSTVAETK